MFSLWITAITCQAQGTKTRAELETINQTSNEQIRSLDDGSYTELTKAIVRRQLTVIRYLLMNGEPPDGHGRGPYSTIPILVAADKGDVDILKLLFDAGARLETKDNNGFSALIIATLRGNIKTINFLLSRGADVNAKTDTGATALMTASRDSQTDIVKTLLKGGADVNIAAENGVTALMVAGDNGDIVESLLKAGATIEAVDKRGFTAVCYAKKEKQAKKLDALIAHGANEKPECPDQ